MLKIVLIIAFLAPPVFASAETLEERGEFISVPSGSFVPLFPDNLNKTKKTLLPSIKVERFEIQTDPVTNEKFHKFVTKNRQWRKNKSNALYTNDVYLQHWKAPLSIPPSLRKSPVTHVSWFAADAYCRSQKLRLPTTSEWEYVASFPLVVDNKILSEPAKVRKILEWYGEPSTSKTPSIENSVKNTLGVRGLFGLVWEWTYDFNSVLMTTDNRANSDKKNGLFCGGGAFGSNSPEDYARFMRYAHRSSLTGRYCAANLGFRCAK